jgi:DNA repair photolyase
VDLLASLASRNLCSVAISLPTMNAGLKRIMEPRVPSAEARLKAITTLTNAGIPVSVLVAPLIPAINDTEIEAILEAVASAGAINAHYIFLRLPHEVRDIFVEWLDEHFPDRARHVMSLIRQASGGRDYDHRFGRRQTGRGAYADMLRKRFNNSCRRHGLTPDHYQRRLACHLFEPPGQQQLGLNL